jgi:hypothetical protein
MGFLGPDVSREGRGLAMVDLTNPIFHDAEKARLKGNTPNGAVDSKREHP